MFDNKSILITGGTGSFGKSFASFLLKNYKPAKIIIFSRDEFKQFHMQKDFTEPCMRFFIGDVRDSDRVNRAMKGVDYVVHAAAMKQVEASEYNPTECIKTNITGAQNIIDASIANKVSKVIALSTDKAASPLNLYGATKLVSDKLFIAANSLVGDSNTCFGIVRYGNVIGSRGSVIPFFKDLIAEGITTLPVTHEEMTRFCITLDEGVQFVCKSFQRMRGGEIFVPKLPSVKISALAKIMSPTSQIEVIGIRPGEKIHEVMIPFDDARSTVEYENFFIIKPAISLFADPAIFLSTADGENAINEYIDYEYSSATNNDYFSDAAIRSIVQND